MFIFSIKRLNFLQLLFYSKYGYRSRKVVESAKVYIIHCSRILFSIIQPVDNLFAEVGASCTLHTYHIGIKEG